MQFYTINIFSSIALQSIIILLYIYIRKILHFHTTLASVIMEFIYTYAENVYIENIYRKQGFVLRILYISLKRYSYIKWFLFEFLKKIVREICPYRIFFCHIIKHIYFLLLHNNQGKYLNLIYARVKLMNICSECFTQHYISICFT